MYFEISSSAHVLQNVCIVQPPIVPLHHPQFSVMFNKPTGSILFKQHTHNSCKTYQLTNQRYNLLNFKSDLHRYNSYALDATYYYAYQQICQDQHSFKPKHYFRTLWLFGHLDIITQQPILCLLFVCTTDTTVSISIPGVPSSNRVFLDLLALFFALKGNNSGY